MDGISADFSAAMNGGLDKGVPPGAVKIRVDVTKEVPHAGEIFRSGSNAGRCACNVASQCQWSGIERNTMNRVE